MFSSGGASRKKCLIVQQEYPGSWCLPAGQATCKYHSQRISWLRSEDSSWLVSFPYACNVSSSLLCHAAACLWQSAGWFSIDLICLWQNSESEDPQTLVCTEMQTFWRLSLKSAFDFGAFLLLFNTKTMTFALQENNVLSVDGKSSDAQLLSNVIDEIKVMLTE